MISKIKFSFLAYITFISSFISFAEVIPKDSSQLHYKNIYFEENFKKGAVQYQLQIFKDEASLKKDSALLTMVSNLPSFRSDQLNWGTAYHWRINALNKKNKIVERGKTHYFKILPSVNSDFFSDLKLDIKTNKKEKHSGGYILIDYLRGIYTREGKPLWILPNIAGYIQNGTQIRDLEFTPDKTITFLADNKPVEIDLECNILWTLPTLYVINNDTIFFHHDFKKTKEGTYFMLGNKPVYRKMLVEYTDTLKKLNRDVIIKNGQAYIKTEVPVLLEVNKKGEVLWYWDSSDYIQDVDLNYKKTPIGFPIAQPHANALGVNDENTKVYLGFRDLSRVIKIDKSTKKVELSYGEKYPSGDAKFANNIFKQQHDARVTNHNSIFILNNNGARKNDAPSAIIELKDNVQIGDSVLLWKFNLDFDTLTNGRSNSGGNVTELPNSNILLCAGQLNRIFEVTRAKEVVWDAFIYSFNKQENVWQAMPNYRGSWVQDFEIRHLPVEVLAFKNKKNNCNLELEIHNVNASAEAFDIEIAQDNKIIYQGKTDEIKAGNKINKLLTFMAIKNSRMPLILTFKSLNFPHTTKQIILN